MPIMHILNRQVADRGTDLEVVSPVLLNTWKHHAGALRSRIETIAIDGPNALHEIARQLSMIGTRVMDLYTGSLSPRELSTWIIAELTRIDRLDPERYRHWLETAEDYVVFTHPGDGSRWVLRLGDESDRHVHLHPGRWSSHSLRVRANVLKTAFLVHIHCRIHGEKAGERSVINRVRREYLQLSPLGDDPDAEQGLGIVLGVLGENGSAREEER